MEWLEMVEYGRYSIVLEAIFGYTRHKQGISNLVSVRSSISHSTDTVNTFPYANHVSHRVISRSSRIQLESRDVPKEKLL